MTASQVQELILDGRGWDNKDRYSTYNQFTDAELLDRLGSWSPIVRERAAAALAQREAPPLNEIIALLDSTKLESRIGACHALEALGSKATPAIPQLRRTLQHEDLWLRVRAACVLGAIGKSAMPALPDMLELVVRGPTPNDPRGMEQRYVSSTIFVKMLTNTKSLDGVDSSKLRAAIALGLQNQDGHARSQISEIFSHLRFEEIQPLLPAILEAIEKPAPSGEMFADGVRLNGLKVLALHHIEEGMDACADYLRTQNPWASEIRTPEILTILDSYGAEAQRIVPHLRETAAIFDRGEKDFPKALSKQKAKAIRKAIEKIEAASHRPILKRIDR